MKINKRIYISNSELKKMLSSLFALNKAPETIKIESIVPDCFGKDNWTLIIEVEDVTEHPKI